MRGYAIIPVLIIWLGSLNAQLLQEGFENAAVGKINSWEHIEGWRIDDWDGAVADFAIVDTVSNSGSNSLFIDVQVASGDRADQIYLSNWFYPVTVPGGKLLEISFYARGSQEGQKMGLDLKNPGNWDNLISEEFILSTSFKKYVANYNVHTEQELGIYLNFAYEPGVQYRVDDILFDTIEPPPPAEIDSVIRRSDIALSRTRSQLVYDRFNVSMIAWGWLPQPLTQEKIEAWRGDVLNVQGSGIKYQARFEVDAGWKNMLDFDTLGYEDDIIITLDSNRLLIPWFSHLTHNGISAYYFCTNSAGFRKFLRYQVFAAVSGSPQSLMFDGQTCTPLAVKYYGGCFCQFCMEGFSHYLDDYFTTEELAGKGIDDIAGFNYQSHLKELGWTETNYTSQNWQKVPDYPLSDDWLRYQNFSTQELTTSLSQYADSLAGKHIPFSTSSPPSEPFRSIIVPEVDMYTEELPQGGANTPLNEFPAFNYKFIESLDKRIVLTGSPQTDWSPMADIDRPGIIRQWIAQAYAHGAVFMVPVQQWAPNSPSGWYNPDYDDFDYIFDFIQENSRLIDEYTLKASSSFLLSYRGLSRGKTKTILTNRFLVENNIPFNIIAAGGDWWENDLKDEDFIGTDAILVNSDTSYLDSAQAAFLSKYSDKVVAYNDLEGIFQLVPRQFDVSVGNEKVWVVLRENKNDPEAPYICHLINRRYDMSANAIIPQDFSVTVDTSQFNRQINGAILRRPGMDSLNLELFIAEKGFRMDIGNLEEWGIVEFVYGTPDYINGIKQNLTKKFLTVYPNPASDFINVNVNEPGILQIFDVNGSLILSGYCERGTNRINISSLSTGFYFVKINSSNSVCTGKFIIR
ncbi:MAG: T9SS type A sorting domain-containing protein [Bacteroidales bacterium]